MNKIIFLSFLFFSILGITQKSPFNNLKVINDSTTSYSFFASGHFHGSGTNKTGYPINTLLANLNMLNGSHAKFIVCLGDLFLDVSNDIPFFEKSFFSKLNIPLFNTVGNHDLTKNIYQSNYGETNFNFKIGDDLHLFFDTETDNGSFNSEQLNLLESVLLGIKDKKVKRLFVYCHRTIWAKHYNALNGLFSDNTQSLLGNNFSKDIYPILEKLSDEMPIYWFSGSLGDAPASFFYHEDTKKNITYIATAIRGLKRDAWLKVTINEEIKPSFETISLTGETLLSLNEYDVNYWNTTNSDPPFNYRLLLFLFKKMILHSYFWIGATTALVLTFLFKWIIGRRRKKSQIS